jgi:N-acetylmuramoyl-L-alanine amidase
VRLLREGDVTIGLDRRAEITNEQRAAVYIALHATSGEGVRVYTSMVEPPSTAAVKLTPWENAQTGFLASSQLLATAVVAELKKKKVEATRIAAPLRPLNNVAATAIAVEVSLGPKDTRRLPEGLQENVVSAVTATITQAKTKIGSQL